MCLSAHRVVPRGVHCTTAILAAQPSLLLPGKPQPCRRAGTLIRRVARPKNDAPDEHSDREPKSAPNAPYVSDTAGQRSDVSRAGEPSTPSPAGESMGQLGVGDAVNMPEVSAQPSAADVASYSAAGTGDSGGSGGAAAAPGGGMSAVSLSRRFGGVGYTFVLAGFLKVVTVGGLALSAPVDAARTAFGKASPYLMVPVGLGMCWLAKQVVDSGLHETRHFLRYLVGGLLVVYLLLVKLMYKYEPSSEWVRRPRPRLPGQMAELRAQLGDKDLLAGAVDDSRSYMPERPDRERELFDDVAWYEGRYPSQLGETAGGGATAQGRRRLGPRASQRTAAPASDTDDAYGASVGDMLRSRGAMMDSASDDEPVRQRRGFVPRGTAAARRSYLSDAPR